MNEVRMRLGKPCVLTVSGVRVPTEYVVTRADIEYAVGVASGFSVYAVNDTLVKGFLHYGRGIRIGIVGEGVTDGERLVTIKNPSALLLRIPQEVKGAAAAVAPFLSVPKNVLVVSPVGAGKTTLLRDMARITSDKGVNTLVIDERYELSGAIDGIPTLDVGANSDVISGVSKSVAYENCIRAMSPELIVTDELFSLSDVEIVTDCVRSGVFVFASIHAADTESLKHSKFAGLLDVFHLVVTLTKKPRVGTVAEIREW